MVHTINRISVETLVIIGWYVRCIHTREMRADDVRLGLKQGFSTFIRPGNAFTDKLVNKINVLKDNSSLLKLLVKEAYYCQQDHILIYILYKISHYIYGIAIASQCYFSFRKIHITFLHNPIQSMVCNKVCSCDDVT